VALPSNRNSAASLSYFERVAGGGACRLLDGGPFALAGARLTTAAIDAVIAELGGRYDADEAEVIERVLREYGGTIPDAQLISEAALALAIWRRGNRRRG